MKPLASNTLLQNRYLVVHLIGKGGMGEVYLAIDQRLGSAVALKRTRFFDDEVLIGAFEREARILARLRHAALPKVSDHFLEDGNQYLVMEYIAGDDLSKRLELANKPFPLEWTMFWADRILDALDYLHSNEPPIIHRDIKPQNLKLTEDNQIVLLDFGLSKNTVDASGISTTAPSVVGYTPQYAPMEQIRGTGTDARSDIYSLASTLYQLLTNAVPPDALARADALLSDKSDPLRSPSELNAQIPQAISTIILHGMEISRDKRIGSARAMQKLLREAYAPDAKNQIQASPGALAAVAFLAPPETIEAASLKTNITSAAKSNARDSAPNARTNAAASYSLPNGDNHNSAAPRKQSDNRAFETSANGDFQSDALVSTQQTRVSNVSLAKPIVAASSVSTAPKTTVAPKSRYIFAGLGAAVVMAAAVGFGFNNFNRPNAVAPIAAPETFAVQKHAEPSVQPKTETTDAAPTSLIPTGSLDQPSAPVKSEAGEKTVRKSVEDSDDPKTAIATSSKSNQKPAASIAESKILKSNAKSAEKPERKPTPLPRILP